MVFDKEGNTRVLKSMRAYKKDFFLNEGRKSKLLKGDKDFINGRIWSKNL